MLSERDDHAHAARAPTTRPLKSLKEAWESAKRRSGVTCRLHDLRHTAATRLLEAEGFSVTDTSKNSPFDFLAVRGSSSVSRVVSS